MERVYQSYVQGANDVRSVEWNVRGEVRPDRGVFRKNVLGRKSSEESAVCPDRSSPRRRGRMLV